MITLAETEGFAVNSRFSESLIVSEQSTRTLCEIALLSPVRSFTNSRTTLRVARPNHLHSSAAHDGYRIIVDQLRADSHRLKFLHKTASLDGK